MARKRGERAYKQSSLQWLHIPKNAGGSVELFVGHMSSKGLHHPAASCSGWHVPPRLLEPNPYVARWTWCVVRHPLDRALSSYKEAKGKKPGTAAEANEWLRKRF